MHANLRTLPLFILPLALILAFATINISAVGMEEPNERCDSQGKYQYPDVATCWNPCTEGCTTTTVQTNQGNQGRMCTCDIIGAPAVCCKMALVSPGHWELVGTCALMDCSGSNCEMLFIWGHDTDPIGEAGSCL